jgi:hypothetical protein
VIRFVVGYYRRHPEFITLLNTENLHKGKHIVKSVRARDTRRRPSRSSASCWPAARPRACSGSTSRRATCTC